MHLPAVRVLHRVAQQTQQVLLQPLLVRDDVAADVCGDLVEHDDDLALHVLHHVQRQRQGLAQIDRLIARHQLQSLAGLGVVDAAVDGHEHEVVDGAHVVGARLERRHGLLQVLSRERALVVPLLAVRYDVRHDLIAVHKSRKRLFHER